MRYLLFSILLLAIADLKAQYVYTIKADSVKITNCDSAELILENHTQNVPGFLYNTGNGRTIFKHALLPIGTSSWVLGSDTLNLGSSAWLQGGNAFGTTGVLGTLDNNPLLFYTNDTERVRVTNAGHLLINTQNDYGNLSVNGSAFVTGSFTQQYEQVAAFGNGLNFDQDGTMSRFFTTSEIEYQSNSTGDQHLFKNSISNVFTGTLVTMDPGGTLDMPDNQLTLKVYGRHETLGFCVNAAGSAGIGTLTPTAQLHTTGSVRFAGLTQDSTQTNVLVADANGNLYYRSASSLADENPVRSPLAIIGTIKSHKIIISPDEWADYVFDSSYRLPGLAEVESYIHREHHLPGIPSAAAVQKDSLDVGAGQAALLKKIEELTLYTIEQKKEMDSMKARMERLEKLLEEKTK